MRWEPASDPFANCDIRGLLDGSNTDTATNNYMRLSELRWHYDQDNSKTVTMEEVRRAACPSFAGRFSHVRA